eukprot:425_1
MSYSPYFDWDKHRRDLNENYKKWKSFQFTDYVFSIQMYKQSEMVARGEITVKNNIPTGGYDDDYHDGYLTINSAGVAESIDDIFQREINWAKGKDANSWATHITYNSKYGYPISIYDPDMPEYEHYTVKIECYLDSNRSKL